MCVDNEAWQFMGGSGEWMSYPPRANDTLSVAHREQRPTCEVSIDDRAYMIDFAKRTQRNMTTYKERRIHFFPDLPRHWRISEEEALLLRLYHFF